MSIDNKLKKLINRAKKIRKNIDEDDFFNEDFPKLSNYILRKLKSHFFSDQNVEVIVDNFDEILPFIVMSNIDILLLYSDKLIEKPNFKEKFILGIKKYPYKKNIHEIIYSIQICLQRTPGKFDAFMDSEVLTALATINAPQISYIVLFDNLNEELQKDFLKIMQENNVNIPYTSLRYKSNVKKVIYDNLLMFVEKSKNLYDLLDLVERNEEAEKIVKEYIDSHEEQAVNSIIAETIGRTNFNDSTLIEVIKLLIKELVRNENAKYSEIIYSRGSYSKVIFIGDKVLKLGSRNTKVFPNNPYIISPLLRKEFKTENGSLFIEITERVDTSIEPTIEELYQLYKNLRELGLIWADIKKDNVGRLKKDNIVHWNRELRHTDKILELDEKRGTEILKAGEWVILDADYIFDENDKTMNVASNSIPYTLSFEDRYRREKKYEEECNVSEEVKEEEYSGKKL